MRRILGYLIAALAGLLVLGIGALGAITATQSGSRWLLQQASYYLPGELHIGGVDGTLTSGLTLRRVDYRLDQSTLRIARLVLRWEPAAILRGTLRIRRLDAQDVSYSEPPSPAGAQAFALPERIPVAFAVELRKVQITGLRLAFGTEQLHLDKLNLSARVSPLGGLVVKKLTLRKEDSTVELNGKIALHRPYTLKYRVRWRAPMQDQVLFRGHGQVAGNLAKLQVKHSLTQPFELATEGIVLLDGDAAPQFKLSGRWKGLRWPLTGNADYTSEHGDYSIEGTLDAYRLVLSGPVEGTDIPALQVHAAGAGDLQQIRLDALNVTGLGGKASAHGTLAWAPRFSLGLTIQASDVDPAGQWPTWPGRLNGTTRLDVHSEDDSVLVALQDLDVQGTLRGKALAARGELAFRDGVPATGGLLISSGKNTLRFAGALEGRKGLRYTVAAPALAGLVPGLSGQISGSGLLKGPVEKLKGSLQLKAKNLAWKTDTIETLSVELNFDNARPETGTVRLQVASALLGGVAVERFTADGRGSIEDHKVSLQLTSPHGTASIALDGGYRDRRWDGRLDTAGFDLRKLGKWRLREPVPLQVGAGAIAPFSGCWVSDGRELCVQGELKGAAAKLLLSGKSPEARAHADIALTRLDSDRPGIAGTLSLHLPDIRFADSLVPDVTIAGGSASAEVQLAGDLGAPRLTGSAKLEKGLVKIPELGIEPGDIELQARAEGSRVTVNGTAHSGEGSVRLNGVLTLDPKRSWPFDVSLKGERLEIARLPDMDILASPDLRIEGSTRLVDVSGSVLIPHAQITLKQLPPDVVRVSPDQVIVGPAAPPAAEAPSTIPLTLNLVATLGDDVHFEGLGLTTDLAGSLNIRSLRTRTLIGNGVLELVNGRYSGYGQKLAIQRGRLLFAGPLDNPALDIRATRTVGDVVAGIELSGTVEAPQTRLFSDPAMSEAEILSYLVTGKPLGATSGTDSEALAAAAASLGANSPVAQELSEKLGINVGVESGTAEEGTSVVVGKQIAPRLHVNYLYGLFTDTTAIQFIYELSRHFSLAGQSGAAQSIDLRFSIDHP